MMTTLPARDTKTTISTLALTPGDALEDDFKESKPSLAYSLVEDDNQRQVDGARRSFSRIN